MKSLFSGGFYYIVRWIKNLSDFSQLQNFKFHIYKHTHSYIKVKAEYK